MVNLIDPKPVINVITGIANPEREAFVARTLFESGKNIIFRAISGVELLQCLENRAPENGRWIVVFADDLPGIETIDIANWNDSETSIIDLSNLKNDLELNSLNELIARSLRNPLVHANNQTFLNKTPRYRSLIGIIGSAGAPGRTSITLNLAAETSQKYQTAIIDADCSAPALALLLGQSDESLKSEFQLTQKLSLFTDLSTSNSKFQSLIDTNSKIYLDLGVMPKISEAIIDRRKSAQVFAQWFEKLSVIIYVTNSEEYSLRSLERFIENRSELPRNIKDFYILNKSGTSRRHKSLERRFSRLVPQDLGMVIPYDFAAFDRAQTNCSPILEVAPRSAIRKSFVELSARIENLEVSTSR